MATHPGVGHRHVAVVGRNGGHVHRLAAGLVVVDGARVSGRDAGHGHRGIRGIIQIHVAARRIGVNRVNTRQAQGRCRADARFRVQVDRVCGNVWAGTPPLNRGGRRIERRQGGAAVHIGDRDVSSSCRNTHLAVRGIDVV